MEKITLSLVFHCFKWLVYLLLLCMICDVYAKYTSHCNKGLMNVYILFVGIFSITGFFHDVFKDNK
jgi:hypothetical protein